MTDENGRAHDRRGKHEIGAALQGRWQSLPPRIRPEDTVASQETPPKPQVIADYEDPFRELPTYAVM